VQPFEFSGTQQAFEELQWLPAQQSALDRQTPPTLLQLQWPVPSQANVQQSSSLPQEPVAELQQMPLLHWVTVGPQQSFLDPQMTGGVQFDSQLSARGGTQQLFWPAQADPKQPQE
jgi:hypothetical protein